MTSPGAVHRILSLAIEAIDPAGLPQLQQHLEAFLSSHPEFGIAVDEFDRSLLVSGDDELQLMEIRYELLSRNDTMIGGVKVNYKESIRRPAEAEGKYIRQISGKGNYGHCWLRIEPTEPGTGYRFVNDIKGGVVPDQYIDPVDRGVQGALAKGILAGYPIVDIKVTLFDGSYHEVDSNQMAFKLAAWTALKEAVKKASPIVLEPVMAVKVTVPEQLMGGVIRDVNSRRGRIDTFEHRNRFQVIEATIPLAELLSSSVHGRPEYPMHFAGYRPAPHREGSFGDDEGVLAKKPRSPKPGTGSAAADLEN